MQRVEPAQKTAQEPLARAYQPLDLEKIKASKQQKELSFFTHISVYCMLMMLILSLCLAVLPALIAFPIGVLLPLVLILGVKYLWRLWDTRPLKTKK